MENQSKQKPRKSPKITISPVLQTLGVIVFLTVVGIVMALVASSIRSRGNTVIPEASKYESCLYNLETYEHDTNFQAADGCNTCSCNDGTENLNSQLN
ncbi:MAG: hypothetical protein ACE5DX_00485 [Candidatus Dojkabacteria bacterium]